eukprot:CAMPEP_0173187494 /NCGR_PEP_ID=MMETSP1141-20130122/10739_1 /TAXON_ID=483371 /ORGANISM="non described non described, Strain CCMP2298" /LENGTH=42 /DNA_ID= /DNA_START= /DNA_END= /DNA_ORIENTATION=
MRMVAANLKRGLRTPPLSGADGQQTRKLLLRLSSLPIALPIP